jgi:putative transposase
MSQIVGDCPFCGATKVTCWKARKINFSHVFAGQKVGITQVGERVWLVTFMHYDVGYFDDETCRLEPIDNPFGPKVLPMCSE